ncbi:MAG: hypothetical protein AAF682_24440 [Planctomycetota bacterium]
MIAALAPNRVAVPLASALALCALPGAGWTQLLAAVGTGTLGSPGGLVELDETFAGTFLGDSIDPGGITGLAFTQDGRLWASVKCFGATAGDLAQLDPATGALLGRWPLLDTTATPVRISDLAVQPGSGVLYGCGSRQGIGNHGELFTIDPATRVAALLGQSGVFADGGLAFDAAGTLYMLTISTSNPLLVTLDPATGAALTSLSYGPDDGLDGLAVRPGDGALLATRGGAFGLEQIVQVDPLTGQTTPLGGTGVVDTTSDLAFGPCSPLPASQTVRLGVPPNPLAFLPDPAGGPLVGGTWAPFLDHTTFQPGAALDFVGVSAAAVNVPGALGTLLCDPGAFGVVLTSAPGTAFAVPVPDDCGVYGATLCAQGGSVDGGGTFALANALDVTVGTY